MDKLAMFAARVQQSTDGLGAKLSTGFEQATQIAKEKFGTSDALTPFPADYVRLENAFEKFITLHADLLRFVRHYAVNDYNTPLQDNVQEVFGRVKTVAGNVVQQGASNGLKSFEKPPSAQKTTLHLIAKASESGSESVGKSEPIGTALHKIATAYNAIGDARINLVRDSLFLSSLCKAKGEIRITRLNRISSPLLNRQWVATSPTRKNCVAPPTALD